jgi:ADP-heptose:LPS heptosyltransferase
MARPPDSAAVLFPGALGDFICFLPTLRALRQRHAGELLLVAKPELLDLAEMRLTTASIDRREIADLFAVGSEPAPATATLFGGLDHVYSWTGFGNADFSQRLVATSRGRVTVYPFRGMQRGEHAADYYARCVGLDPLPLSMPRFRQDRGWLADFNRQHQLDARQLLVIHPGSGAPRKNWQGFEGVIAYWRLKHLHTIVLPRGPADAHGTSFDVPEVIEVDGLSLPQVAALLAECALYLGNDSGISHLAGAVGAHAVVLFGPSDPSAWAPRGDGVQIVHAPAPCAECPDTFCVHRLPVESVIHALEVLPAATSRLSNL